MTHPSTANSPMPDRAPNSQGFCLGVGLWELGVSSMYNRRMLSRALCCLAALAFLSGCVRSGDVQTDLKIIDVRTGWYDAGIVEGKNKLVPSISLKIQNVSGEPISNVQVNAIFRR